MHEPEVCYGSRLHCWSCNEDEPDQGCYIRCGECGHVYLTEENLRETWLREYPLLPGEPAPEALPAEDICFCPLCIHDF